MPSLLITQKAMDKIQHRSFPINGLSLHVAEVGHGPVVLFLHGFPELWYSWRHQMVFLADHGYRAVAPDMRGFGDTTGAPLDESSKSSIPYVVGDIILLLEAMGEEKVFVAGHDWGAVIAWHLCMYRPDKVKAVVNISVPFMPRDPNINLVDQFRAIYGPDHYISRFQEPGDIEAEFAKLGVKQVMTNFLAYRSPTPFMFPKGEGFGYTADRPSWLSEQDLDYFVSKYERTGFTGGVNYYRALPLSWELNAPWTGAKVMVPAKFIVAELDLVYHIPNMKEYIHKGGFKNDVPLLQEVVVIEGAAHFTNQERPDEINQHIYDFLKQF